MAPLARGPLNVNGDEAAAALALGLGAERIVFLTDVEGLYLDGALAQAVCTADADRLLASRTLQGGIVPKLPRRSHRDARRCARRDRRHRWSSREIAQAATRVNCGMTSLP